MTKHLEIGSCRLAAEEPQHPDNIVNHPDMTTAEKRAVLASWISDARAVENQPALRRLDNGTVVSVDDILQALKKLDRPRVAQKSMHVGVPPFRRRSISPWSWRRIAKRFSRNDDDDPPPAPAIAAFPVRSTVQQVAA